MQRGTGKSVALAGMLASTLFTASALASAGAASQPVLSTTVTAELFGCVTFLLLALVAHWAARRQRTRS